MGITVSPFDFVLGWGIDVIKQSSPREPLLLKRATNELLVPKH
jgi:hypothetical protein